MHITNIQKINDKLTNTYKRNKFYEKKFLVSIKKFC